MSAFFRVLSRFLKIHSVFVYFLFITFVAILFSGLFYEINQNKLLIVQSDIYKSQIDSNNSQLQTVIQQYNDLKNQDQVKINQSLNDQIKAIHDTYSKTAKDYEQIVDLRDQKQDTKVLDQKLVQILNLLADKNESSASATLADLDSQIKTANDKLAASLVPKTPATTGNPSAPVSNTPPGSGYSQQQVQSDVGTFTVDIISADLSSTKVIVDTASDGDCGNNCPVMNLAAYVSRNGAFAGINGSFFCPASYPSCAGKTNSFDTLLMNKNKHYFNSDNNVYSNVPAAIFSTSARFVGRSLEWGRDTSPDAVIANYPLLVQGNNVVFSGSDDPKFGSKGARCFIGNKGSTVYIGCVLNATMSEGAHVLKSLGLENALNLDEGGSTALWSGGYKLGPGRDLPNAVLFVRR